jgi:hypothetical protein
MSEPITRADLKEEIQLLRQWMLEREVKTIRWLVGTQIVYFAITLSAVYFLLKSRRLSGFLSRQASQSSGKLLNSPLLIHTLACPHNSAHSAESSPARSRIQHLCPSYRL